MSETPATTAPVPSFYAPPSSRSGPATDLHSMSLGKGDTHRAAPRFNPQAHGAIVMPRPSDAHQAIFNPRHLPLVDVVVDPNVGRHMRPHQVEGVKFLYECVMGLRGPNAPQGAILADEMGLGKTLQTIVLIHTLLKQSPYWNPSTGAIRKAVVVCPLTLVDSWKREFHKWLGSSSINVLSVDGRRHASAQSFAQSKVWHVMIIGYEKLRGCVDLLQKAHPPVDLVVCDEGHRLKSREAKTTKMFDLLPTPRRILLSGTPIQNDLSELHTMVDIVAPGILGTYANFKKEYEDPIVASRVQGCTSQDAHIGQMRSNQLRAKTSSLILHRSATILNDYLPSRTDLVVFCAPSAVQLQVYEAIVRSSLEAGLSSPLVLIGILRKLCDSTRLLSHASETRVSGTLIPAHARRLLSQRAPLEQSSGKLAILQALISRFWEQTEDKVVIVSHFTSALDVVQRLLSKQYTCARLDGHTPQEERYELVKDFNGRPRSEDSFVFLLSAKSGGVGLNLIGANRLILLDSDWNPSQDQQAMARIHRDGQRKACFVYRLLLSGTLDEKVFQRQQTKLGLSGTLMQEYQGEEGTNDAFTPQELRDLFTLHTGTPCLTHDQLGCTCLRSGSDVDPDALGTDVDTEIPPQDDHDESSIQPSSTCGLVLASQLGRSSSPLLEAEKLGRKASGHALTPPGKDKLASLFSWEHQDCTRSSTRVADPILQSLLSPLPTTESVSPFDLHSVRGGAVLHVFQKGNQSPGTPSRGNDDKRGSGGKEGRD